MILQPTGPTGHSLYFFGNADAKKQRLVKRQRHNLCDRNMFSFFPLSNPSNYLAALTSVWEPVVMLYSHCVFPPRV